MAGADGSTARGGTTAESVANPSPNQGVQATQTASARSSLPLFAAPDP